MNRLGFISKWQWFRQVLLLLILTTFAVLVLLKPVSRSLYPLVSLSPAEQTSPIVLIHVSSAPEQGLSLGEWRVIRHFVERGNPKITGVGFLPPGYSPTDYPDNWVVGREAVFSPEMKGWVARPGDKVAGEMPVSAYPSPRQQKEFIASTKLNLVGAGETRTLPVELSYRLQPDRDPPSSFMLDLRGNGEHIPVLTANQIIEGAYPASLLTDKVVIIGKAPYEWSGLIGASQPFMNEGLTLLQYQGVVLHSLLGSEPIRPLSVFSSVLLCLLLACGVVQIVVRLRYRTALKLLIAIALIWAGISWFSLHALSFYLPVIEGSIVIVMSAFYGLYFMMQVMRRQLRDSVRRMKVELGTELPDFDFLTSRDPWRLIMGMGHSILGFRSAAIFSYTEGDTHIETRYTQNFSQESVAERRKDINRYPLKDAIEKNSWIRVNSYLDGEEEYVLPFIYDHMLLGMLVFRLDLDSPEKALRLRFLQEFTRQASEGLYYYGAFNRDTSILPARISRSFQQHGLLSDLLQLQYHIRRSINYLNVLQSTVDQMPSPSIVFDSFGLARVVNEAGAQMLLDAGMSRENCLPVDLLRKIADIPADTARTSIASAFVAGSEYFYPCRLDGYAEKYLLKVKSITSESLYGGDTHGVFDSKGLMINLIDVGKLHQVMAMKDMLAREIQVSVNNVLSASILKCDLLAEDASDSGLPQEIKSDLQNLATQVEQIISISNSSQLGDMQIFPSDLKSLVQQALDAVAIEAETSNVTFNTSIPHYMQLAMLNHELTLAGLIQILQFLIKDSLAPGEINVSLSQNRATEKEPQQIRLELSCRGYGVPKENLLEIMKSGDEGAVLSGFTNHLDKCQAHMDVHSEVGVGTEFSIYFSVYDSYDDDIDVGNNITSLSQFGKQAANTSD